MMGMLILIIYTAIINVENTYTDPKAFLFILFYLNFYILYIYFGLFYFYIFVYDILHQVQAQNLTI